MDGDKRVDEPSRPFQRSKRGVVYAECVLCGVVLCVVCCVLCVVCCVLCVVCCVLCVVCVCVCCVCVVCVACCVCVCCVCVVCGCVACVGGVVCVCGTPVCQGFNNSFVYLYVGGAGSSDTTRANEALYQMDRATYLQVSSRVLEAQLDWP